MRRGTWVVAALTAAVVAVGVAGCSADGGRALVPVTRVEVRDESTIDLVLDSCVPDPQVTDLAESDTEIAVAVSAGVAAPCDSRVRVKLDEPLGERAVVDARRGGSLIVFGRARQVAVLEAVVIGDGTLLLDVPSCEARAEVTRLDQGADTVEVEITVTGGSPLLTCLDRVQVVLDAPLGDRQLRDATTGGPVPITGYMDVDS